MIRSSYRLQGRKLPKMPGHGGDLFRRERNSISDTAWACAVYSMVPYLGILFVPFALSVGTAGYVVNRRKPEPGGERKSLLCLGLSVVLLIVQLMLWSLLYLIPEIGI